ncbi:MAG TPA: copper-binding protein [Burkholderiales bacterium]|jgi:Cu/Ag efflux protein CusF
MKRTLACALAVAASLAVVSPARAQGMSGMEMKGGKAENKGKSQAHKASGTVTKVDAQKGNVTIAHGPVQTMNWPAMTMTFKVKDKAALNRVKQGDKLDFSFVQSGKDYIVTEMK